MSLLCTKITLKKTPKHLSRAPNFWNSWFRPQTYRWPTGSRWRRIVQPLEQSPAGHCRSSDPPFWPPLPGRTWLCPGTPESRLPSPRWWTAAEEDVWWSSQCRRHSPGHSSCLSYPHPPAGTNPRRQQGWLTATLTLQVSITCLSFLFHPLITFEAGAWAFIMRSQICIWFRIRYESSPGLIFKKLSTSCSDSLITWCFPHRLEGVERFLNSMKLYYYITPKCTLECTIGFTYTQEFLQECFRSIDVNAGDGAVASQHSIHRGRNLPPVVLSIGVEVSFVMFYVPHPVSPENGKIKYK